MRQVSWKKEKKKTKPGAFCSHPSTHSTLNYAAPFFVRRCSADKHCKQPLSGNPAAVSSLHFWPKIRRCTQFILRWKIFLIIFMTVAEREKKIRQNKQKTQTDNTQFTHIQQQHQTRIREMVKKKNKNKGKEKILSKQYVAPRSIRVAQARLKARREYSHVHAVLSALPW